MVKQVSKSMYLLLIGGGYVVAAALFFLSIVAIIGGAAAAQQAGEDSAAAGAAVLGASSMMMLAVALLWVPAVAFFVLLYKAWAAIQDPQVRTTPGKAVGFMLIPFFNIYWMFMAIWGWAQDYNGYTTRHGIGGEKMSEGLFLAYVVSALIFPPVAFILMFMVVAKLCDGINTIATATPRAMAATAK
jgi:hypothetical protein